MKENHELPAPCASDPPRIPTPCEGCPAKIDGKCSLPERECIRQEISYAVPTPQPSHDGQCRDCKNLNRLVCVAGYVLPPKDGHPCTGYRPYVSELDHLPRASRLCTTCRLRGSKHACPYHGKGRIVDCDCYKRDDSEHGTEEAPEPISLAAKRAEADRTAAEFRPFIAFDGAPVDALIAEVLRSAQVWRMDPVGRPYRREDECHDNGGSCCWTFDDKDHVCPIPAEDGGGWHWDSLFNFNRGNVSVSRETFAHAVACVNAAPVLAAECARLAAALAAMAEAAELVSEQLYIVQPFLDVYKVHGATIAACRARYGKDGGR